MKGESMRESNRLFFEVLHKARQDRQTAMFLLRYGRLSGISKALKLRETVNPNVEPSAAHRQNVLGAK